MHDGMAALPTFEYGEFRYAPQKNVLLILPSAQVIEFNTVESALAYLETARRVGAAGAHESTIFSLQDREWVQLM